MGLSVEYSGLAVIHLIYKVVPLVAVMRWLLCWAFRYTMGRLCCFSQLPQPTSSTPPKYCSSVSAQMIHESLPVTTYDEDDIVFERSNSSSSITTTCAVCLNELKKGDVVRELRNCCHVFHRKCIDRWADNHHQYKTCPLCRAPLLLLPSTSTSTSTSTSPSWAVERLLYLFGDDLFSSC